MATSTSTERESAPAERHVLVWQKDRKRLPGLRFEFSEVDRSGTRALVPRARTHRLRCDLEALDASMPVLHGYASITTLPTLRLTRLTTTVS